MKYAYEIQQTLFDTPDVRKKASVMSKFEIMQDDSRNDPVGEHIIEQLENFLQFGKSYKITVLFEEV